MLHGIAESFRKHQLVYVYDTWYDRLVKSERKKTASGWGGFLIALARRMDARGKAGRAPPARRTRSAEA